MNNSAMSRQIDTKTMLLTIICVVFVLLMYTGLYTAMVIKITDPDTSPFNDTAGELKVVAVG